MSAIVFNGRCVIKQVARAVGSRLNMGKLLNENNAESYPRVYGKRDDGGGVVVTFTFTQSVEYDAAELVGLSNGEIIERARVMAATAYDWSANGGAYLLLGDADADLENMRGE